MGRNDGSEFGARANEHLSLDCASGRIAPQSQSSPAPEQDH